jgi:hypothetical protein
MRVDTGTGAGVSLGPITGSATKRKAKIMDPNVTLANIRSILTVSQTRELSEDVVQELIEHVEALDEWITKGGFLPAEWVTVPATSYDIATRMPNPNPEHDDVLSRFPVGPLDGRVFDAHAAFVANEMEEEPDEVGMARSVNSVNA